MGKRGDGFGSEDHFLRYRAEAPAILDRALLAALRATAGRLDWVYPTGTKGEREPTGVGFVRDAGVSSLWKGFWPARGRAQTWDGVARLVNDTAVEWVLIEVKANAPEFVTPPCGALREGGRATIERSLNRVKTALGVHRYYPWIGTYYQHANRLAVLYFLNIRAQMSAHFLDVYITSDVFPDGTECPASEVEWQRLIEARRLTLGLPIHHALSERCHQVFLPALKKG